MFTVLWDNDGVLVETEGLYFQATKTVLKRVGIDLTPEHFREISLRRGESTFQLAAEQGIPKEEIACLRTERDRIYAESLRHSGVIEGVEEALRSLHGRVQMGIVTSSRRDHFNIAHAESGLLRYMDFAVTREDYEHTKPNPEPYLTAMKRHCLVAEQCIVVEDSERGLASARAAGLKCLIVLSEWTQDGDFSQACKVLRSISDVPDEVLQRASHWQEGQQRRHR
ncbi:MAG: HAD family hydrolase [Pirellulaceae bacterium]